MEMALSPAAAKYAVLTTACLGSPGGVEHRVRHDRASWVCTLRASVGIGSRHWSVLSARRPPVICSSPPPPVTVTGPPPSMVPDTGAGPHAALHSCTVKFSLTADIDHAPSNGPSARAERPQRLVHSARADAMTKRRAPARFEATAAWRLAELSRALERAWTGPVGE